MKVNKKECRKFADPGIKMPLQNGLLHAAQVKYIVRTAIKIINHHRILILYLYDREKAAQGNFKPCMTMFQSTDDFITLSYKDGGSTFWRKAAFERLDENWCTQKICAFYSQKDEVRIGKYFKSDADGFAPLIRAQDVILERRRIERQRTKEKHILDRMAGVPAMPRGLKAWIHKSVMSGYFFYDFKKGGRDVPGVCSACGREIKFSGVKQGKKFRCPNCRKEIIAKPRSRRGRDMYDRKTCQVIQRISDRELVIRIVKVYYKYQGDVPDVQIYENARQFIIKNPDGRICTEAYYYVYHDRFLLTPWKEGERPSYSLWQEWFEADTCGHVYTKNLPDTLAGTPWQYCPIKEFYNYWHESMQSITFLAAYHRHPALEHLVKTGFYSLVSDIVFRYTSGCLDETQHRTHQIIGVAAEDVPFLRDIDVNIAALQIFQKYTGLKDRQKLLLWQIENKVEHNILPILQHMTVHKAVKYLDNQFAFLRFWKTKYGAQRYNNMQDLVTEYWDYLEMCKKMNYDLKNNFVKYPADLQKAHDKVAGRLKHKEDARIKRAFMDVYKSIAGKYDFEKDGMKIVYPETPGAVVKEGHALHHCVGDYTNHVASHSCVILFLRQCCDLEKSFYTIEIRGSQIVQIRGMGNCVATPDVEKFIKSWKQRVLDRIEFAA